MATTTCDETEYISVNWTSLVL